MAWTYFPLSAGDDISDYRVWEELIFAMDERSEAVFGSGDVWTGTTPAAGADWFSAANIAAVINRVTVIASSYVKHTDAAAPWDASDDGPAAARWVFGGGGAYDITTASNANIGSDGSSNHFTRDYASRGKAELTVANKLYSETGKQPAAFTSALVGATATNLTTAQTATINTVDNSNQLGLSADIFTSGDKFITDSVTDFGTPKTGDYFKAVANELYRVIDLCRWALVPYLAGSLIQPKEMTNQGKQPGFGGLFAASIDAYNDLATNYWPASPDTSIQIDSKHARVAQIVCYRKVSSNFKAAAVAFEARFELGDIPTDVSHSAIMYAWVDTWTFDGFGGSDGFTFNDYSNGHTNQKYNILEDETTHTESATATRTTGYFGEKDDIPDQLPPDPASGGERQYEGYSFRISLSTSDSPYKPVYFLLKWDGASGFTKIT